MVRMSWPRSSRCVAKDGGRCGSWPPSPHRPRGQPASPPSAPHSDRDGGGPGHRLPFRASGSPGLTCRQKAHESPRLRVARCGVCDTYAAINSYSNRQSTCSSPAYRISMSETSCVAVDLAFQQSLSATYFRKSVYLLSVFPVNTIFILSNIYIGSEVVKSKISCFIFIPLRVICILPSFVPRIIARDLIACACIRDGFPIGLQDPSEAADARFINLTPCAYAI